MSFRISTNRKTIINIAYSDGKSKIVHAQLNYDQKCLERFKKIVDSAIRLSPDDPVVEIDKILFKHAGSKDIQEFTEESFQDIKNIALASDKVYLQVAAVKTECSKPTPSRDRRASSFAKADENDSVSTANILVSPSGIRKYTSPARKTPIPTQQSPGVLPRSGVRNDVTPSSPGGTRSRAAGNIATPITPGNRSTLKLNRPISRKSPGESTKAATVLKSADCDNLTENRTVTEPTCAPRDQDDLPVFTASDNNGDLLSALCGQKDDAENNENDAKDIFDEIDKTWIIRDSFGKVVKESKSQANENALENICKEDDEVKCTWITRKSDGSVATSADAESVNGPPVRDNNSTYSASSRDSAVSRNLDEALLSAASVDVTSAIEHDSNNAIYTEMNTLAPLPSNPDSGESAELKFPDSNTTVVLTSKRSSVLRQMGPLEKRHTAASTLPETGDALIDGKTILQVTNSWASTLRTTSGGNFPKKTPKKTPQKESKGKSGGGRGGRFGGGDLSPMMMKAMRRETRDTTDDDGRPSMATMMAQWEFMREQFLGSSEEQLEWLMESRRGGAYRFAHNKNMKAEDQYFKSIVDIEVLTTKLKMLKSENSELPEILKSLSASYEILFVNPNDEEEQQKVYFNQTTLKQLMDTELKQIFSTDLEKELKSLLNNSDFTAVSRKARRVHSVSLPEEIKKLDSKLTFATRINEESLKEMEKWSKREKETAEYERVMAEEDRLWMQENEQKNTTALNVMRSFIPVDISAISVQEVMDRAKTNGHFMTLELAQEIKSNKLLHWIVTATEDIAFDNFLNGEKRQYFVNIECLDVTEMRAIRMCLPYKFELDNDAQKQEWRERFLMRLKQLTGQENEELVKGSWDPEAGKRSMIKLPPLKADQARRPIYFFRTYNQCLTKLKQYDDKVALLEKKQGWLRKAEEEAIEKKSEYETILLESRDTNFKNMYGAEVLAKAKELAKKEMKNAENNAKTLQRDVLTLKNNIENAPITREQFVESMSDIKKYLLSRDIVWESEESPVRIVGSFPQNPDIVKSSLRSQKFLSPEEEARQRKIEIEFLSAKKSSENDSSDGFSDAVVPPSDTETKLEEDNHPVTTTLSQELAAIGSMFDMRRRSMLDAPNNTSVPIGKRKNSVLLSANPEMLDKLNSMLSGNGPLPPVAADREKYLKRSSMLLQSKSSVSSTNNDAENVDSNLPPAPPNPVKTSSKTLLKLVQASKSSSGECHEGIPPIRPQPMSFLDQIKARSNLKSLNQEEERLEVS